VRQSIDLRKEREKEEANPPGGWEVLIWDTRHHDEDEKINLVKGQSRAGTRDDKRKVCSRSSSRSSTR
jgi:hypothetical protein